MHKTRQSIDEQQSAMVSDMEMYSQSYVPDWEAMKIKVNEGPGIGSMPTRKEAERYISYEVSMKPSDQIIFMNAYDWIFDYIITHKHRINSANGDGL